MPIKDASTPLVPGIAAARNMGSLQGTQSNSATSDADKNEVGLMVGARGALDRTLDAKKAHAGQEFHVTLADTAHLKNGPELPSGTVLLGKVVTDDMETKGNSKLALCIYQAKLKDGKIIEIKATITGVNPPGSGTFVDHPRPAGDRAANPWHEGLQQVDQIDVLSGVDLHSKVSSKNSGVLVSTKKDEMKLKAGTEFALAIAFQGDDQQTANGASVQ
jgi:hypothetical protein